MSSIDTHSLIVSKENIQPLRHGRDTSQLSVALQAETNTEKQQALEKQRNEFEINIRSEKNKEDPLADWCDYANWIEQSFPRQPREGKLNVVLKRCLKKFMNVEKYMNDPRFVKLCIKYADIEENSIEILQGVYTHGIGVKSAELYIAWAEKYALQNCIKKAHQVYEKGVKIHAEPFDLLEQAQTNFLASVARNMIKNQVPEPAREPQPQETRQAYNVLKPIAVGTQEFVPNVRIGSNVLGEPGRFRQTNIQTEKPKSNTAVKIFQDDGDDAEVADPKTRLEKIPTKKSLSRENLVKAGVWTDKTKKNVPFSIGSTRTVPFQVHVDDDSGEPSARPQAVPSSVLKSHKEKDAFEDENYAQAPLFYQEPYDPQKIPVYCKDQVYTGGLEFQFEELRAIIYRRKKEEEDAKKKEELEQMEKAKETHKNPEDVEKAETAPKGKSEKKKNKDGGNEKKFGESKRKTLFGKPRMSEKPPKVTETDGASPGTNCSMNQTIHTKEALSEMQQLWFSKPASPLLNVEEKKVGKSILKPGKPQFNLFVDESCLENFNEPDKPLDLSIKSSSDCQADSEKPRFRKDSGAKPKIKPHVETENAERRSLTRKKPEMLAKIRIQDMKENMKVLVEEDDEDEFRKQEALKIDDEDKENDIPVDYGGPRGKSVRKVTGILTPSENIPVRSLSDEEAEDEAEDDDADFSGIIQCNNTGITETVNFTKAFQCGPRNESTPKNRKSIFKQPNSNESIFVPEDRNKRSMPETDDFNEFQRLPTENDSYVVESKKPSPRKEDHFMKNLTIIAETSREYKSSSSGSSGVSTINPSKNYPFTPSETRSAKFSLTSSHMTLQKTKALSINGYDASNELSNTGYRSHIDTVNKQILTVERKVVTGKLISFDGVNENFVLPAENKVENTVIEEIDPFNGDLIDSLLKKVGFPDSRHASDYFNFEGTKLKSLGVGRSITLGSSNYEVKKILGEGAYAKIYKLQNEDTGEFIIAKYQNPPFPWEFYITREIRQRISNIDLLPLYMNIEKAYFFDNASILLTKPVEYGDLLTAINKMKQRGINSQLIAIHFTVEILQILKTLHSCKIIHGDIKPDNFLVAVRDNKLRLQLIDFGRSIDMTLFSESTVFKRVVTTEGFTTIEMQTGKPWTYQIDLYGAANCSHCLLFGDYMSVAQKSGVWNISKRLPRYWSRDEWENYFVSLLNVKSCYELPDLSKLIDAFDQILKSDKQEFEMNMKQLNGLLKNR